METFTLRGISAIRLSVLTDETTSPTRQRDANDQAAGALNIEFVGEALDLDVSASKTTPFDRPELGDWLTRPDAYDAIVWWRFDRAVRSQQDMHDLAKWAIEHRKMLVFAHGVGGGLQTFDFRNPMDPVTRMMLNQFAFAAEMEAWAIKERVTGAQAAMRTMPLRWRGARPPYGYMPAPMPAEFGGSGQTLIPDPDAVEVIERIIRELISGKTASAIALGLNTDQVATPRDHWSLKKQRATGGKPGGAKGEKGVSRERFMWNPTTIKRLLTSPTLLGWKMHKDNPVRNAQGAPVMATADPILTRAEFDRIGELFAERAIDSSERKDTGALLLRVIHCHTCEARMYQSNPTRKGNAVNGHYKCNAHARGASCDLPANVRADWADAYAEREFLRMVGGIEIHTVRVVPGYDPAPEIAATLAEFETHQEEKGRQKSNAGRAAWQQRADALDTRLAELEARPKVEPVREVVGTGRTFADEWAGADMAGRRAMLVEAGARLTVKRGTRGGWRKLDESRVEFTVRGDLDPAIEELMAVVEDYSNPERPDVPTIGRVRLRLMEPVAA
ncbi:recombinase family protein [Embleya sp. NBC_00888]|uniref:recombinase family protein n=1 Tax=Embleya sp. NBC_00888 TaxID=2975960 RepID=UPI00386BA03F|nr:recombinase family protein [Embleya sp. NBC_00888]